MRAARKMTLSTTSEDGHAYSPLLALPAELRTYIYALVVRSHSPIEIFTYWDEDAFTTKRMSEAVPLLSICKQVRNEAFDVVIDNITFYFRPYWQSEFVVTNPDSLPWPSYLSLGPIANCSLLRKVKNIRIQITGLAKTNDDLRFYHLHSEIQRVLQEECDLRNLALEWNWACGPKDIPWQKNGKSEGFQELVSRVSSNGGKIVITVTSPGHRSRTEQL